MKRNRLMALCSVLIFYCAVHTAGSQASKEKMTIIAHRGGVVDSERSENSLKALEEAIRRGYTHVEVDARVTKDGQVVAFHENNMKDEAGIAANISDFTLAEVQKVVLTRSQEHIPTFEEYCARAKGRIGLMVDIKGTSDQWLEAYTRRIDEALKRHGLLENALFIINQFPVNNQEKVVAWFLGRAKISWRSSLRITEIMRPHVPDPAKYNFVFNGPADFTRQEIDGFHKMGLKVIASVNTQDYRKPADPIKQGLEDIQKMLDWGVDGLQIDSVYDPLVFQRLKQR